jgi:signal transduction histidine kinase/ligand-binding sensor domain-containing protein
VDPRRLVPTIRIKQSAIARALVFWVIFGTLSAVQMAAVDPHRLITQYGHTAWRVQDGLLDRPFALTQTTDGTIWIGTSTGLLRFDGVTFRHWAPFEGDRMPYITTLLGARDGSLWIGTSDGLYLWRDGVLSNYIKASGDPGISDILEDHRGTIWLTRYRVKGQGPLCRVAGAALECFGKNDGIPGRYGLGMAEDQQGNLWFGCQALCRWPPGSSQIYFPEQFQKTAGNGVSRVAVGPSGTMWATLEGVGPKLGVQYYSGGKWSSYVVPGFDGRTVVSQVLFTDRDRTLWIGTQFSGLYHIHDGFADHYGTGQGLSDNYVKGIYQDKEGNIWITTDRGIDLFRDLAVVTYASSEGLVGASVHSVIASDDGTVLAANEQALDIIRPDGLTAITTGKGLPGQNVEALFKDNAGRIFLGIDDTLMTYKQGRLSEVRNSDGSQSRLGAANSFAQDTEGNVWALVGPDKSDETWLLRIRGERIEEKISTSKLLPKADGIVANRDGGLWVLYNSHDIARFRNGKAEYVVTLHRAGGGALYIHSLGVDFENAVWIATARGLYRFKDRVTILDSSHGLPCDAVYSMIKDNDGAVWLYTRCGVVKISAVEWANWLKSPESKVSGKVYDALDGAQGDSSELDEPLATKTPDGRLWFVSTSFIQMVDPGRNYANATPPPVHIEEVFADHKKYPNLNKLELHPLANELEIDYTAMSFAVPRRVLFRYKLEGHDKQWQEAGTRRQAFYNDLGPGRYRFRVIACNNDGVWNEAGASLEFSVLPTYYQTGWFHVICAAVFLVLVWVAYQLRVQRLQRQFAIGLDARVNERTRIARELHDTLLQSLHGLMFQFQAARNLLPMKPGDAMRSLDDAINETENALAESRDAIQGLRSEASAAGNLSEFLLAHSRELSRSESRDHPPAVFDLIEEGERRTLAGATKGEICRIALEILRNAFRHAEASRIEAEVQYGEHSLRVRIRDDGKGIDPKVLKEGGRAGHWGLRGTRERAERIGAHLEFWSETGAGTEVELTVPAAMAYETQGKIVGARWLRKAGSGAERS